MKVTEDRFCITKLRQPHPSRRETFIVHCRHLLVVDVAGEPAAAHPHKQPVPLAKAVAGRRHLAEHLPLKHARPVKPHHPQLAAGGIEAVVTVAPISVKREAGRPRLVGKLHAHREVERGGGHLPLSEAKRPSAEARAGAGHRDQAAPLLPAATKERRPAGGVEPAEREPARHWHGVWLLEKWPECRHPHREAEVLGD